MAYIGTKPTIGNFQICDAISVVNGQAAYTMQVGSVNVIPQSANHMIVSLNGTIQKPNSSFTVSGSTITFASNLATGDVIDFIQILGDVLDLGVPSDGTVTTAKIVDGSITSAKLASGVGGVAGITSSADATAITIDSSERVGIGTSSPTTKLNLDIGTDNTGILVNSTDTTTGIALADNGGSAVVQTTSSGALRVLVGGDANTTGDNSYEGMRIHDDGEVDINVDRNDGTSLRAFHLLPYGTGGGMYDGVQVETDNLRSLLCLFRQTTSDSSCIKFFNTNGNVGKIKVNGTSTSYNTTSDHRLKENVNYDFDATTRLKQLKPARFNFIADADTTLDGFIAHEVKPIVPEAVHGTHNEVQTWREHEELPEGVSVGDNKLDENGNTIPKYQGIDQAKLVPLLVKTIQELEARITALENA